MGDAEYASDIFAIYGSDVLSMTKRLLEAADAAAGIDPDGGVAIKPNLVVARPASEGATTHPEIVAGIIEYLQDHGIRRLSVIESSWLGADTRRAFAVCGYGELAKRYGVELHDLKSDSATPVSTPAGTIRICDKAFRAACLVNAPVLKGHCQTRLTCALKNLKGCLPDSEKRRFHQGDLNRLIAGLATALRPRLTLADSLCGDLDFEEGGNPVPADRLFLGRDPFRVDVMGCRFMGFAPGDIGYLRHAASWGMGSLDGGGTSLQELNQPATTAAPRPSGKIGALGRGVRADQACSACYGNLIHALKRLDEQGIRPAGLCIGQGWKGKKTSGIGVGDCCRGAAEHVPGCPPAAADIVAALART